MRYYDYPPEQHNLAVRRMILRNTLAELEAVLPPELNPGEGLSIPELRAMVHAMVLECDMKKPENPIKEQALAVVEFKLGGALLMEAMNEMAKGASFEDVEKKYDEGIHHVGRGNSIAKFCDLRIMGRPPHHSANAHQKLAINIRDIVNIDEPIEPLITAWYKKIAAIKQDMQDRAVTATPVKTAPMAAQFAAFAASCEELLEARRNEPEYIRALANTAHLFDEMKQRSSGQTRLLEAAEEIYWMARVREPLSNSKPRLMVSHA
ncbi:MAG: hypothetical protein K2Q01_04445 [Rickettsiales bacterium]|nr:hypothetical protein [Rickettsiales bacterium]